MTKREVKEVTEMIETAKQQARQDEREKMQGVDVWVSWDEVGFEYPIVTIKQPIQNTFTNGEIYHTGIGQNFSLKKEDAEKLGIQKGQCKKFRIVWVCDE